CPKPPVRRPAPPGARARAGQQSEAPAARRADGGHEPERDRDDDGAHQQAQVRARLVGPAHRARHAGRDGHQRPDHGPGPRRAHRRGDTRGGPGEPQGHRGVPRKAARVMAIATEPRTSAPELMLELQNVHTYYGRIRALQGVSLEVRKGEIVTLIGANGAGKTTILKTISGLLHAREGQVRFQGADITQRAAHDLVKLGIGHAPEGRRIFSRLTVYENLQMGAFTRTRAEAQEDVERMYSLFPRLRERSRQQGGSLSGGEQQMLAVARALMSRPSVLLLDEPSLGLAPILIQEVFSIIQEINTRGTTVLLVEQNALQALNIAQRGYVLQTGRVIKADTADRLAADPDVRRAYLGEI